MSDINGSKPTNFPLDESKLDFKIPRTDAPRENVLKLDSMITNRIGLKATADDPEYWGLAGVMTDEMVDVALKMGVRKPKTTEQLMKLTKMEREPLEKDHAHGAAGRRRHRHARHPCGKGHRDGERVR